MGCSYQAFTRTLCLRHHAPEVLAVAAAGWNVGSGAGAGLVGAADDAGRRRVLHAAARAVRPEHARGHTGVMWSH